MTAVAEATVADAPALAALHAQCFDDAWDAAAFAALLAGPGVQAFMAADGAFIVVRAAGGEAEILTLATAPHLRRRGHARALVRAAAAWAAREAKHMFLEVAADNAAALALYTGLGFARAGRRPGYYVRLGDAADALILRAALPLSPTPGVVGNAPST
jgi:ribosomal-protein-alanine N-acetyltransferase